MDCSIVAKQPVLFISHGGGPCFFMKPEDVRGGPFEEMGGLNSKPAKFLANISSLLPEQPKAIVLISAHWDTPEFTVSFQNSGTSLVYDYYGFPKVH